MFSTRPRVFHTPGPRTPYPVPRTPGPRPRVFHLAEREGRTGEYWPEVVEVRTERSKVRTKTTEGQYFPVRIELARLVSSLLYGTAIMLVCFLLKRTSGDLNSKGFLNVFLMTRATQKEHATTSLKTNSMSVKSY